MISAIMNCAELRSSNRSVYSFPPPSVADFFQTIRCLVRRTLPRVAMLPRSWFRARQETVSAPIASTAAAKNFGLASFPMESPAKWVSIGSDEQRNERAFGTLAGSETLTLFLRFSDRCRNPAMPSSATGSGIARSRAMAESHSRPLTE